MKLHEKFLFLALLPFLFQTAQAEWIKQDAKTLAWLHDIYFFNENHGLIAGGNGTLLETKNGGKSWAKRKIFTEDNIRQIYFTDEFNGWLLCERSVFNRGQNSVSYLLKTTDGGENWEKSEFKNAGRARVTKVFFSSEGKGFAVGESGAVFELNEKGEFEKSPSPLHYLLLDGIFSDKTNGAIVGAGGNIYFTEDAGASWNPANLPAGEAAKLNSVFFVNPKNGWTVGTAGKIFQTSNGGKMWREQRSKTTKDLFNIFFKNTAEGWAVGDEGTILHTQTAGNVWSAEETPIKHKLEKVLSVGRKVFALGFGGTILINEPLNSKTQSSYKLVLQNRNQ